MDFLKIFSKPITKEVIVQIISEIRMQPVEFQKVFDLIFNENNNIAWRAAWVVDNFSRKNNDCICDKMKVKLMDFSQTVTKDGHLRLCLSILLNAGLPANVSGEFINFCFGNILNKKTAVAVKALSVKILSKICETEPDLRNELKVVLQNIDIQNYTAGMKSVVKHFFSDFK